MSRASCPVDTRPVNCLLCSADVEHLNVVTEKLRDGPGRVLRCESCDIEMLDQSCLEDRDVNFYDGEYRRYHGPTIGQAATPEEIFGAYRNAQLARVNLLIPYVHANARLLEVGCSAGQFLAAITKHVRIAHGVDADTAAIEHAQKVSGCRTYPTLEALAGHLAEFPESFDTRFDVICAYQTLEHTHDPQMFMEMLKPFLAPNGVVVIEVPSINDPLLALYDIPGYREFFYHSSHNWYFSPESLNATMEECGFSGHIEYVQDYNFLNHLSWIHTGQPQRSCESGLGVAMLPIPRTSLVSGDLFHWAEESDIKYKRILQQHGYTENITFLGRAK